MILIAIPAFALVETTRAAGEDPLGSVLVLLAIVSGAYLFSYLVLKWAARRFGWVSGVQYVVLGVLLGPVFGVLTPEHLTSFTPVLILGSGAVGLMVGLELNLRRRRRQDDRILRITAMSTLVTLLFVVGLPALALTYWFSVPPADFWFYLSLLGALALVADPFPVVALGKFLGVREDALELATGLGWLSSIVAILVFGLLFFFFNPADALVPGRWEALQWFAGHIALGAILGAIAGAFIQMNLADDRLLTILGAVIILASGIAHVAGMSVVFVNFIAGAVIIQMSSEALRVERIFAAVNRPLYILLLFFVGTLWVADVDAWVYVLVALYLGLRYLGRILGVFAYRPRLSGRKPEPGVHRALWAPGALTAAMIIDASQTFSHVPYAGELATGLVMILIGSEIVSHLLIRGWLIDIADTSSRRAPSRGSQSKGEL